MNCANRKKEEVQKHVNDIAMIMLLVVVLMGLLIMWPNAEKKEGVDSAPITVANIDLLDIQSLQTDFGLERPTTMTLDPMVAVILEDLVKNWRGRRI